MSAPRRPTETTALVVRDHTVIGTPAHIETALRTAHAHGHLVDVGTPVPMPHGDRRVRVRVRLAEPEPAPLPRSARRSLRRYATAAAVGTLLAILAGIGYAVYLLIVWVIAHWVLIVAGLILAVVALVAAAGSGAGMHCPGCRR